MKILSRCREALSEGGEVFVVESVLKGRGDGPLIRLFDLLLLTVFGGVERTEEEYSALFDRAGLRLKGVIPTEAGASILVGCVRS